MTKITHLICTDCGLRYITTAEYGLEKATCNRCNVKLREMKPEEVEESKNKKKRRG